MAARWVDVVLSAAPHPNPPSLTASSGTSVSPRAVRSRGRSPQEEAPGRPAPSPAVPCGHPPSHPRLPAPRSLPALARVWARPEHTRTPPAGSVERLDHQGPRRRPPMPAPRGSSPLPGAPRRRAPGATAGAAAPSLAAGWPPAWEAGRGRRWRGFPYADRNSPISAGASPAPAMPRGGRPPRRPALLVREAWWCRMSTPSWITTVMMTVMGGPPPSSPGVSESTGRFGRLCGCFVGGYASLPSAASTNEPISAFVRER